MICSRTRSAVLRERARRLERLELGHGRMVDRRPVTVSNGYRAAVARIGTGSGGVRRRAGRPHVQLHGPRAAGDHDDDRRPVDDADGAEGAAPTTPTPTANQTGRRSNGYRSVARGGGPGPLRRPRGDPSLLTEEGTLPWPPTVTSAVEIALWDMAERRAGEAARAVPRSWIRPGDQVRRSSCSTPTRRTWGPSRNSPTAGSRPRRSTRGATRRVTSRFLDGSAMPSPPSSSCTRRRGATRTAGAPSRVTDACSSLELAWLEAPAPRSRPRRTGRSQRGASRSTAPGDPVWDTPPAPRADARDRRGTPCASTCRSPAASAQGSRSARVARIPGPAGRGNGVRRARLMQPANLHVQHAIGGSSFLELPGCRRSPGSTGCRTVLRAGPDGTVRVLDRPGLVIEVDWRRCAPRRWRPSPSPEHRAAERLSPDAEVADREELLADARGDDERQAGA